MIINKLKIKNFKNLQNVELDFTNKKVIVFRGDTGNGKSAIFDFIAYLLTDYLEEKLSEYIRWSCNEFEGEMSFQHLNQDFFISVSVGKTTKKKLVIENKEEFFNSEATKKLSEIIDSVITRYSAISYQGQSTQLLFDTPSNRLKKLREILKIDKVILAADNIKNEIKVKNTEVDKIQAEIKTLENINFIYMDLPVVKDKVELEKQFNILQDDKKKYDLQLQLYNQYILNKEKYEDAQSKILTLTASILEKTTLKNSLIIKELPSFLIEEFNNIKEQLKQLEIEKVKYDNNKKDFDNYQKAYNDLNTTITDYENQISNIKLSRIKLLSHTDSEIEDFNKELNALQVELKQEQNKLVLAKNGKCPTCGQDYISDIIVIEKHIQGITRNIANIQDILDAYSIDKKIFDTETKEQNDLKNKKQSLHDRLDFTKQQLEKIIIVDKPEEKNFDNEIKNLNFKLSEFLKREKEYNDIKGYNDSISTKLITINTQIDSYNEQIQTLQLIEIPLLITEPVFNHELYDSIKNDLLIIDQQQKEYDKVVKFNKDLKEESNKTNDKILMLTKEIQDIRNDIRILEGSKNVLEKQFSAYLIDKGCNFIRNKMNEFFGRSYGKYSVTLKQDNNSVDFFYSNEKGKLTSCGLASGFEKQVLAMSNRIALCSLGNLGILMMDESDSESSAEKSLSLFQTLLNETQFNQFFIITHKQDTQEYLSHLSNSVVFEIKNGSIVNH